MPDASLVEEALRLADLGVLGFVAPAAEAVADPAHDAYWHVAAFAFAPAVREARAAALATLARESAAGAPGPIIGRLVDHEFGGDDVLVESVATLDLVGLLGLGPAGAARELAEARSLLALAALDDALWRAPIEVDRARIDLEAAAERGARLRALHAEAKADLARVEILADRGRIGASMTATARGMTSATEAAFGRAAGELAAARGRLATAAGLAPSRVEAAPVWGLLSRSPELPAAVAPDHPSLRRMRLQLSVAEASLRSEAARSWPGLRLGPHFGFPGGDLDPLRLGGLLGVSVPFPSSYEGVVEAAVIERDRALERYAEAVLALRADLAASAGRAAAAEGQLAAAIEAERATAAAWKATRAGFRNGRVDVAQWISVQERRRMSIDALVAAKGMRARAALDARRAAGPVVQSQVLAEVER